MVIRKLVRHLGSRGPRLGKTRQWKARTRRKQMGVTDGRTG